MQTLDLDDNNLLKRYAEHGSEEAFGTIVSRHVAKVYSVALRHTRNPGHAEEITQAVFVILAKKVNRLEKRVILSGWLYETARLTSVTFVRSETRRTRRQLEAHMQKVLDGPADEWIEIAPLLDSAMGTLNEMDRNAVVLRFFDGKSMREVGTALGSTEESAKKRVSRALEKLRIFFIKRGAVSTTTIIAGAISSNSVQAAPVGLAKSVVPMAIAKGATAGGSTLSLVKGSSKAMAWTKMKSVTIAGLAVLLAAGTTTVGIKEYKGHRIEVWEAPPFPDPTFDEPAVEKRLSQAPSEVRILPSRYDSEMFYFIKGGTYRYISADGAVTNSNDPWVAVGVGLPLDSIVRIAYATKPISPEPWRTIYATRIPMHPLYDYISNLPDSSHGPLQDLIREKFGITAKWSWSKQMCLR